MGDSISCAAEAVKPQSKAINCTCGNHSGGKKRRGLEQYATPPGPTEALLSIEPLPKSCWNPCGTPDDNITIALRAAGKRVVATDITLDGIDFRARDTAPRGVQAVVANPPFSLASAFVLHGLKLVSKICILERVQFLEAEARAPLFAASKLARVYIFIDRVPRMHKLGWTGRKSEPAMTLCWFVFERDYSGKPVLDWIRCRGGRP